AASRTRPHPVHSEHLTAHAGASAGKEYCIDESWLHAPIVRPARCGPDSPAATTSNRPKSGSPGCCRKSPPGSVIVGSLCSFSAWTGTLSVGFASFGTFCPDCVGFKILLQRLPLRLAT